MKIFIWGTGKIANQMLEQCYVFDVYEVLGFIDNDPHRQGKQFRGKDVFSPDVLKSVRPDKIVVLTDYFKEIKRQIGGQFPDLQMLVEDKNFFFKQIIFRRYENTEDAEIKRVLEFIKKNEIQVFNYDFIHKYRQLEVDVHYDANCGLFYVYHKEKRLYFADFLDTEEKVRTYYLDLLMEQDNESPHKYLSDDFDVNKGDIVVDVGAAEGNFSLDIIEKASKVYLIESDRRWIAALKETFHEYQEKTVIIQKFVTSIKEGNFATLDSLIEENVDFIKMDIEGSEWDGLLGAEQIIKRSKTMKCAICSYHSSYDEVLIKDVLKKYRFLCSTTPGYMWWIPPASIRSYSSMRLCRGIVRGMK